MNSKVITSSVDMKLEKERFEQEHLVFTLRFFLPRMGFKSLVNWHHEYIADKIDQVILGKVKNLDINVPPSTGKTELLTNLIARGFCNV